MTLEYNESHRTSFSCPEELRDVLDEEADRRGTSRSKLLLEATERFAEDEGLIGDTEDADDLPDDPKLRDAYLRLHEMASHRGNMRVTLDQAKNELWDTDVPKSSIRSRILHPLQQEKYIALTSGIKTVWVNVRPRQQ